MAALRYARVGDPGSGSLSRREAGYHLGKITSGYEWKPDTIDDKPHTRRVSWTHVVPRDSLSSGTRNTLGAIQTLFKVAPPVAEEIRRMKQEGAGPASNPPSPPKGPPPKATAEEGQTEAEIGQEKAAKATKKKVSAKVLAGLARARAALAAMRKAAKSG